jgi:hypothetical protein
MVSDPTRQVEDRLSDLLDQVIAWLQFAESKNTGIVGLIATALGLIVTFLVTGPSIPTFVGMGLVLGPMTDLERVLVGDRQPPGPGESLIFYGHLARYESRALVQAVAHRDVALRPDEVTMSRFASDLAVQIVTNARITVRKLRLFRAAVLLFGVGVLTAATAMALAAVMR